MATKSIVPVRMDEELRKWLRLEAERRCTTVSEVIREAIVDLMPTEKATSTSLQTS